MIQLSASSYQFICPHCQWRSTIHNETSVSTHETATCTCPICNQNTLLSQPVHMLDWLFEQAMQQESRPNLNIHPTENAQAILSSVA